MLQFRAIVIGTDDIKWTIRKVKRIATFIAGNEQTTVGQPSEGSLRTLRRPLVLQIWTEIEDLEDRNLPRSVKVI